jgi:hypothetical protein
MKPLTLTESFDHLEFACRAVVLICASFLMGLLIGGLVSDREVES